MVAPPRVARVASPAAAKLPVMGRLGGRPRKAIEVPSGGTVAGPEGAALAAWVDLTRPAAR